MKYLDFSEYRNVFPIGFNEDKTRFMIFFDPFNSDIDKVQKKLNERKVEYVRGSKSLHIITNPELLKSMLI